MIYSFTLVNEDSVIVTNNTHKKITNPIKLPDIDVCTHQKPLMSDFSLDDSLSYATAVYAVFGSYS